MNTKPVVMYLVRHGETIWNRQGKLQGHSDSDLTEEGIEKIKELAEELKEIHFDAVFSSDLLRAQRTAEIIAVERKLAVNTTHLLRERRFGKNEGKPRDVFVEENKELIKQFESLTEKEKWKFKYSEDNESSEEMATRLLRFLREVAVTYEEKTVLVVTHGGVLRVLFMHLGSPLAQDKIGNGAYVKLLTDGVDFFIKEVRGITPSQQNRTRRLL